MKKHLLIFASLLAGPMLWGQSFSMTNGSAVACSGTFYDSGGSGANYANNESLVYTLCGTPGNCISITFTAFNTQSGMDVLEIYDGPDQWGTLLGTYSGNAILPGTFTSPSGCLTFVFTSNNATNRPGWAATITCAPCPILMSNSVINVCGGTYTDDGGPSGNYSDWGWIEQTICSANPGECVRLNFSSFQMEPGLFDFLEIYDGPSSGYPLIGTFTGNTSPGMVTSTYGCLTMFFYSDGATNFPGWQANISCVSTCTPLPPSPGDCPNAIPTCTNFSFSVTPNGFGNVNEIPPLGSIGNPMGNNPGGSGNFGCLQSFPTPERNSTWILVTITSSGTLEFSLGDGASWNCYDWIMYPYNATACAQIPTGNYAPVRCNWNGACSACTGIANPANYGLAGCAAAVDPLNFEPALNVLAGQQYVICFSNYSSATTLVPLVFFGSAGIACNTLDVQVSHFTAQALGDDALLSWDLNETSLLHHFRVERQTESGWELLGQVHPQPGQGTFSFQDKGAERAMEYYRIGLVDAGGNTRYSEVRSVPFSHRSEVKMFPNPAENEVQISAPLLAGGSLRLVDATGRELGLYPLDMEGQCSLDLSLLGQGMYFILIGEERLPLVKR